MYARLCVIPGKRNEVECDPESSVSQNNTLINYLLMPINCLFCKIIAGDIPAHKIYEDDIVIAILDIAPVNPGHTLVIPKQHYPDITQTPDEVNCHLIAIAKKLAPVIVEATNANAFNLGVNTGAVAGQSVFHTHLHIMPRKNGDGHEHWRGRAYQEGDAEETVRAIKAKLSYNTNH